MTHINIDKFLQKRRRGRKTNSKIFMNQLYTLNTTLKYILTSALKAHRKKNIYIYDWHITISVYSTTLHITEKYVPVDKLQHTETSFSFTPT